MKIGAAQVVITPSLDTPLAGYYYPRMPAGVHDDLHAKALIFDDGIAPAALVTCDLVKLPREVVANARKQVQERVGIPPDRVLITAAHSHTGPVMTPDYARKLEGWIADAVEAALGRWVEASLYRASATEPSLPHNRRYLMKDGSVATNPGFLNPDVVKPMGPVNPRVAVLVAKSAEGRAFVTWVNYALHQDTVGGDLISADFSYFLSTTLAGTRGQEMLTIFTIGAAGDVNHWDVSKPGPQRGFETAEHIGGTLGAQVLRACEKLQPVAIATVRARSEMVELPLQKITAAELAEARKILETPPPPNVDFTLERVKARKVSTIGAAPDGKLYEEIQVIAVGEVAFVAIPGEPFAELGMRIVEQSPFAETLILELANGNIGYIPTRKAYEEGGYEPTSSILAPGGGELIAERAISLLRGLKAQR